MTNGQTAMIRVTRLDDSEIIINTELIEHIKIGVDTVITLTDGTSFVVKERWQELVDRVVHFKRLILQDRPFSAATATELSGGQH